jgi:hypothetical protein
MAGNKSTDRTSVRVSAIQNDAVAENTRRRFVRFVNEDLDAVPLLIRTDAATLLPGIDIEVEVGGRWTTQGGRRVRVDGHWVHCEVVAETARELLVKLRQP